MKPKKILQKIIFILLFIAILFIGFIFYAASDNITFNSLNSTNSFYRSVRYKILTDFFRTYLPENYTDTIPEIDLKFNSEDINHLVNLQGKIPNQKEFINNEIKKYNDYTIINQWESSSLFFEGKNYVIKWKSHGREPIFYHSNGYRYLSLNIKLNNSQYINRSNHFRLIVHKRLQANMKVNEYMANHFGIIYRKHRLFKVTQNGEIPRLYWFEDRYNNNFSSKHYRKSLVIFSKKDEKSHIITNDTNIFEITNSLQSILLEKKYNQKISDSILYYYKKINELLINNYYDSLNDYFETDYITSFMAARMLGGCDGHGMEKRNFYMYFDTISYKFFPCLTREENYSNYKSADSIEYYFDTLKYSFFNNGLFQNDKLRQETYKKVFNFIQKNENQFIEDINYIYHSFESKHFPSWVKSSQGLEHLHELPYFYTNIDSILKHLSMAKPSISTKKYFTNLQIKIQPNSFSALVFKELKIKCNVPSAKFNVTLKLVDNPEEYNLGNIQADKLGIISIENLLDKFLFYDKLDINLIAEKTQYVITLNTKENVAFIKNPSFKMINLITNKIIN